ncbi:SLAM family member 6-like [Triplophysa dalaica]|uniref:SLAM family member 6-like n=1 Tax=Triplophysa dalaica TaxID=1582913 RepID=UPI0024E037D6|nr:SLAM family member 6-like [Triplophysa dalaica]
MCDVMLFCLCLWSLSGVFCEFVSVTEGESVTLSMNLTEHQRKQGISWTFGARGFLIAEITRGNGKVKTYADQAGGRFRDRLKLDQTGSLTITNITANDFGLYEVTNTSTNAKLNTFNVTVYAHLPVPFINSLSLEGLSSSKCVLLCSVMNVSHVSLSWYKGKSLLSSTSVSEHISSISLHLECLDDSYTCVVNNSITNQTQHLAADVCHKCSGLCSCGFTVAVIRLVLSALVGVATVAVMVFDVRSRRNGQKMGSDIQLADQ